MKDYKRLTQYMQVGNNIVAIQPQRKERIQLYIDRLFELEDKIEIGELCDRKTCKNITDKNPVDEFVCSSCGFIIDDFSRVKVDDDGEVFHYEYEIRYCPNCGAKVGGRRMTEQELREKIKQIVAPYVSAYGDDERIADALIAAQIGDVSGFKNHRLIAEYSLIPEDGNSYVLPNTPLRVKQLYSGEEVERIAKERDEYKHRAEVAGREAIILSRWLADKTRKDYPYQAWLEAAQKQAEKELAEERKDD